MNLPLKREKGRNPLPPCGESGTGSYYSTIYRMRKAEGGHQYPEWYKHESLFKNKLTKRERIGTEELLSLLENDPLAMPEAHINVSRDILLGRHD